MARLAPGERRPAALGLFGALDDLGLTAGPALAAGLLAVVPPAALLGANAASFALSAVLLAGIGPRTRSAERIEHRSLFTDLRVGLQSLARPLGRAPAAGAARPPRSCSPASRTSAR